MLLKKQIKDTKIKALYDSSNVLASTYDTANNDLILIFKSGSQYKYPKVSLSDYTRLEVAESQGVVFNSHIKKYAFEKMEVIDPKEILNEALKMKQLEDVALAQAKQERVMRIINHLAALGIQTPFPKDKFDTELKNLASGIKMYFE